MTAVRTHSSQLLLPELPPTLLAASDIDAYASGRAGPRAAGDAIGIFILLSITAFTIMADDDTISLPEDPLEASPEQGPQDCHTWLADLRHAVPPPSIMIF